MTSAQPGQPISVGVDFDNTLVSYDSLIHLVAAERGLIDADIQASKKLVRDTIRELPKGEEEWQKVQALVYGPRIGEATPAEGATEFLSECFRNGVKVNIVSHKTEFASYDETGTNLRSAAMSWLEQNRILDAQSYGLTSEDIYFESTRKDKVKRIGKLGCTHFIDDLEETFMERSFPSKVKKLLYSPHLQAPSAVQVDLSGDWTQMTEHLFHGND